MNSAVDDEPGRPAASSSSTRTVADQVYAFASRQNRNGESGPQRFCETNPISLLDQAHGRKRTRVRVSEKMGAAWTSMSES